MRIAAGVLIIITAVMNLIAGAGYGLAGGAGAAANEGIEQAQADKAATAQMTDADKAAMEEAKKLTENAGMIAIFGIFLLVLGGLQIAGGVVLFIQKAATFALVVGVLGILGELGGIFLTAFGITNILGLVASVLVILSSKSYSSGGAAA